MSTVAAPAVTPDELLRMPDEGRGFELVDGGLRALNVSTKSSRVGARMVSALNDYADRLQPGYVVQSDASFQCFPAHPTRVRRADAAYIAAARLTREQYEDEGHCSVCPDVVAEVISPNDLAAELDAKVEDWIAAGARLVWVIDPDLRIVFAYTADAITRHREADTLTGEPVLPGFAVPVADLFKLPGA